MKRIAIDILHDTAELAADPTWHDWTDHTHPNMNSMKNRSVTDPTEHEHTTLRGERTGPSHD